MNRRALLCCTLWLLSAVAAAQAPEDDLYLQAMQSIAEGRQADASLALARMIAQGPRHAGEWLDLALVQCALGHDTEAEQLFASIERNFEPPPGIRDIINQQRSQGCHRWRALSQWSVSAARGHDSNVNQGASSPYFTDSSGVPLELLPEYKPHSDGYAVVSGDYLRELNPDGDLAFAQAHLRKFDHQSHYDSASLFAGAEHPWRAGRWKMRSSAMLGVMTLGGQLYQQQAQTQLRAAPPLTLPKGLDLSLLGGATYTRYPTLSNFDATTLELRALLGYRDDLTQAQAAAGYQYDRGDAHRPGGDRDGWSMRLYGRRLLSGQLIGELEWTGQRWTGATLYSPGIIDLRRAQTTQTLRGALSYALSKEHSVQLEWRAVRNRENISIFQYRSRQVQLSWRWTGL